VLAVAVVAIYRRPHAPTTVGLTPERPEADGNGQMPRDSQPRLTLKIANEDDASGVQARVAVYRGAWHIPTLLETDSKGYASIARGGEPLRVLACRFASHERLLWAERSVEADFVGALIDIRFRSLSTVAARVINEAGLPIPHMPLKIGFSSVRPEDWQLSYALPYLLGGKLPALNVETDSSGEFTLSQVPGEFRLNLVELFSGTRSHSWSLETDLNRWGAFWLSTPRAAAYTLLIRRVPKPAIALRVVDVTGQPAPQAWLVMWFARSDGQVEVDPAYGRTSSEGRTSILLPLRSGEDASVAAGSRLWIVAWHEEKGWAVLRHAVVSGEREIVVPLQSPASGAKIRGVILDAAGSPLAGCAIVIKSTFNIECEARTGKSGEFSVVGFPRIPPDWPEQLKTPDYDMSVDHASGDRALLFMGHFRVPVKLDADNRIQADPD
jgi:hypothetical protein